MKKICFVTTVSITLKTFVLPFAEYLYNTNEYEIHFACDDDAEFRKILPTYITCHPISMRRGMSLDGFMAAYRLRNLFKKEKFDIVQYSTPNASCYASIAAKAEKVPVRLYCQWGIAYVGFSGVKRSIFKFIERLVCHNSTWVEPDSFGNLNFSRSEDLYDEQKSSVIWNGSACGVDLKKFVFSEKEKWRKEIRLKYNIPDDAIVYIFIGRITRDKGINELFLASRRLFEKHDDAYLLVVGDAENPDSVDRELYNWSVEQKNVIYCGYTNEVEKYLSACDVYLLPSYREGFGSAVIEAESMGVPVIVTDIPGPTDAMIKDKTGLVVKKGDADLLLSAMELLYSDAGLREEFGAQGKILVETSFDQSILFKKIKEDRQRLLDMSSVHKL